MSTFDNTFNTSLENAVENNSTENVVYDTAPEIVYYSRSDLQVVISRDKLSAYVRVNNRKPEKVLQAEMVYQLLEDSNVVFGIREKEINEFCESGQYYTELLAARGYPATNESNGEIVYHVEQEVVAKPKELETGNVDYYDLGIIQEVKAGQELCTLIPPSGGIDGKDVFGRDVPFKKGRVPKFPMGQNTKVTEDGLALVAACEGVVSCRGNSVAVSEVFIVNGDVDNSTGNIVFSGSIVVKGDVRAGFKLISGGDVSVNGIVEGAHIEAQGSIQLRSGMIGMNTGNLNAKGKVVGKYFENCTIIAGGDVSAKYYVNCNVNAKGVIHATDKIVNGSYISASSIVSKNVGSESSSHIRLALDSYEIDNAIRSMSSADNPKGDSRLEKRIKELKESLDAFEKRIAELKAVKNLDKATTMKLIQQKASIQDEIKKAEKELAAIKASTRSVADFKIIVKGIIYAGTKVSIGSFADIIDVNTSYSKFCVNSDGLNCVQLSAADRD